MASAPENRGRQRSYTVGSISKERSRETRYPLGQSCGLVLL